ncbi:MAG: hypothetical protein K6A30_07445 [Lachnospiraceae bacterium]|nr:hypothetical protein [Lachnospiraceae bacterium]
MRQKDIYKNIAVNGNNILLGGAATLQLESVKGNFAIAFSEDYEKKDEALEVFETLTTK